MVYHLWLIKLSISREFVFKFYIKKHFVWIYVFSTLFTGFMCSDVKRGGNTVAHLVARWDMGPHHQKVCMDSFPQSDQTLADLDLI